eukprot:TRINITY_DN8524_c0_g1_i1.p1 TRINITY_DN8524_c0_g1~~TRINITY_DN8524_c0_g1_i1.p1  ORF type:complete len:368 (+),score=53.53 TRINITY_DN8524_c0_g1_i1:157-1260(+)
MAKCTMKLLGATFALLVATAVAHSNLIYPKPRNAIDSNDPRWHNGTAPDRWNCDNCDPAGDNRPCACRNGTDVCDIGQTCLWMSVGCSIGCKECDGGIINGTSTGANPNSLDRCGSGMKPTVNDPLHRTFNRECTGSCIGSADDWTKFNPWRAPGSAPVFDACGRAGGASHGTPGKGYYLNTSFATLGDMGSNLPKQPTGAVWKVGSVVETMWSIRANHGGGWQFRLCPLGSELTEECFQSTPMPFAGDSRMMMSNGTMLPLKSTFVSDGTLPLGSTWQMLPIPTTRGGPNLGKMGYTFPPPCYDPTTPKVLGQGICTGEWISNITMYDQLRVPEHLDAGEYVLGFRWDCESSAQVWQSCADVTITK